MTDPHEGRSGLPSSATGSIQWTRASQTSGGGGKPDPHLSPMLGTGLAPAIQHACEGCLSDIHWFRTDWQRGGALTGYATYRQADFDHPVVVKLPVPPQELHWLRRLQSDQHSFGDVVPRLLAGDMSVNGYDLAWVVMERLPHGPLDSSWHGTEWDVIVQTLARFYAASEHYPVDQPPRHEDWPDILRRARKHVHAHELAEEQRWHHALKILHKKLKKLLKVWNERDVRHWCHGDVHLANVMTRDPAPLPGRPLPGAMIFDFACVHAGHWVEDAVYLEHIYWGREQYFRGHDLVKAVSHERKTLGLKLESNWPLLANIRRALLAGAAPAYLASEGNPTHIHGSLHVLEHTLPQLPG